MALSELEITENAIQFARKNKKTIAKRLTPKDIFIPEKDPVSVFMAGSPGAGKTEASKSLIEKYSNGSGYKILRIDPDELREEFEYYDGSNSFLFQGGVSILVEKIHDLAISNKQSFILDGTLSNFDKAVKNIERSINRGRFVQILYVYQDPKQAWFFVKEREKVEGRNIKMEDFIHQYFKARDVVNNIKEHFGKNIHIDLIHKNVDGTNKVYQDNINKIDNYVEEKYNPASLEKRLLLV